MKTLFFFFLCATVLFTSCKKETPAPKTDCIFQSVTASDNSFTEKVNYDGSNNVLSIEEAGGNFSSIVPYKDARGRVYKIDYYQGSSQQTETVCQFDASNRITIYSFYQQGVLTGYVTWSYASGNHPSQAREYDIHNGNTSLSYIKDYTYDSRGNVITAGGESYTYDDKPNATKVLSFIPDPLSGNVNNIISHTFTDHNLQKTTTTSTYTYDKNGNVATRKDIDGQGVSTVYNYAFQCN